MILARVSHIITLTSMGSYTFATSVKGWSIDAKRMLGSGAWCKVYVAFRERNSEVEYAAVKIIDKLFLKPHEKHFPAREIECLRRLEKVNNILRLLDDYEDATHCYLFLQYCRHKDLFDIIEKNGKLPEPQVRYVLEQLVTALKGAHTHGVLHRDLKLENVLITEKTAQGPSVAVCDFGLSVIVPNAQAAKLQQWVGSPEYASPELVNKIPYGAEVDVWALGVILYTIAVGSQPFTHDTVAGIFHRIRVQPASLPATISDNLRDLITKMLDKNATSRIKLDEITNHPFLKSRPNKRMRSAK